MKHSKIFLTGFFLMVYMQIKSQSVDIDSIVNIARAKSIIEYLCADSLKGRWSPSPENKIARDFIRQEFFSAGLSAFSRFEDFLLPFTVITQKTKKDTCYNVIAGLQGKTKPSEVIIFSAHYDHIGTFSTNPEPKIKPEERKNKSDSIYNGANDDASGIAALILLARYFAALNNNERTIMFVAFSGEELGLLGSAAFVDHISPERIKAVINIEMIGRSADPENVQPFVTGGQFSNLVSLLNKSLRKNCSNAFPRNYFINDPYKDEYLFFRSDNYSFVKYLIPAHSIMLSTDEDKYYHSINDEPANIDYASMIKLIKAIAYASYELIAGTSTPDKLVKGKIFEKQ